jgi:hypothetical protein
MDRAMFEGPLHVTSSLRPACLRPEVVRKIELRLRQWPGVPAEIAARERWHIENLVDLIAEMVAAGKLSRKALRAYPDRVERETRRTANSLRLGAKMPLKPYVGFLASARSQELDRRQWPSSSTAGTATSLINDLDRFADNAAQMKALIPLGGGRTSMADVHDQPAADVMCAAATIEAIGHLSGMRPKRSGRLLWMICQAFWEAAGGKDPETPDWNALTKRTLRAKPESRTDWAVTMANWMVTDAITKLTALQILNRSQ